MGAGDGAGDEPPHAQEASPTTAAISSRESGRIVEEIYGDATASSAVSQGDGSLRFYGPSRSAVSFQLTSDGFETRLTVIDCGR